MGKNVFANGMEIAHKAGDGKVIAAFPDVCLSPPPPPTGPVPVPYPDSSFARDLQSGSRTVVIGGKPMALKDQSFYKTSPLGDEPATRNFGGSVITHTITGATYFQASSMDVVVEGKKVCRHIDITTSNHASYPGSTPPFPNLEKQAFAERMVELELCPCCNGPKHGSGEPMHRDEWYRDNMQQNYDQRKAEIAKEMKPVEDEALNAIEQGDVRAFNDAAGRIQAKYDDAAAKFGKKQGRLENLMRRATERKGCTCQQPPPTSVLPSPPCDVFYKRHPPGKEREAEHQKIVDTWDKYRERNLGRGAATPPALRGVQPGQQVNHLTPKGAGGCPTGDGNLQAHEKLCAVCKQIDQDFNEFQS